MAIKNALPIYALNVSMDDTESGVSFVALVDHPAIERNFQKFDAQTPQYKFEMISEEKQIISGALMLADTPIYRKDKMGEYYVTFSADSISNIVKKFFKQGNTANVNEMHNPNKIADGVYMFESFIIDTERMTAPKGFEDLPNGSWFGSYKVDNPDIWVQIKAGTFMGFSVEGNFIPNINEDKALLDEIMRIIAQ